MLVFTPFSHEHAGRLRSGLDVGVRPGCAVTPSFLAALGPQVSTDEADFAALSNAGVLALLDDIAPTRLVLAVDVRASQIVDRRTPQGEVEVSDLLWSQVQALFTDEPDAAEAVDRARHGAGVSGLGDALATLAVTDLLDAYDLLWYSVEELDALS